jgi:PHD/YefM family antitoxin component YafN of YafNO toxin-antitoxin module
MNAPQYITDNKGNKLSVVLPIEDYQKIMEELEELEDIRLYDEAKKNDTGERIPMEEAFQVIEAKRNNKS